MFGNYIEIGLHLIPSKIMFACRREALLMWKERNGPDATYNNLIRIFEGAGNRECADFIRKLTFGKSLLLHVH